MSERHSTAEQRNTELFDQIADVLEFTPKNYNQKVWGHFRINGKQGQTLKTRQTDWKKFFGMDSEVGDQDDVRWLKVQTCDTAMCIAGHAANLSGFHPVLSDDSETELTWGSVNPTPMQLWRQENTADVADVAEELLGITSEEGNHLFASGAKVTSQMLREIGRGSSIFEIRL